LSKVIQAVRGMNDLLPDVVEHWQRAEEISRDVLHAYGYREIRFPAVEKTELFARSIGRDTDIVEKEMYTFEDRNGDSLTLRPEGTAGCARAGIENGLLHNQIQRFWYAGAMFRHERPQKGRYRQFHQIGVEAFGMPGPDIDAELIFLTARLWNALAVDGLSLRINSLGTPESRALYRRELVRYLESRRADLDEDSRRRLDRNPIRILDSKNPAMREVINDVPSMMEHLDDASRKHFEQLCEYLDQADLRYDINPRLVRGLDYYTRTVFEWVTDRPGSQATVCAGGRYDGLVEMLGGKSTPAVGFALGMERLIELLVRKGGGVNDTKPQIYLAILGDLAVTQQGMKLAESLRDQGLRVACNCGGGSLKTQLKRADRSDARYALLLGEEESKRQSITIKNLRQGEDQVLIPQSAVVEHLKQRLA